MAHLRYALQIPTYPSNVASTTVPFDVVPARGNALADTAAAMNSMEIIVEKACILRISRKRPRGAIRVVSGCLWMLNLK